MITNHKELLDTYNILEEDINNYMDFVSDIIQKLSAEEAFTLGSNYQSVQSSLLKMQKVLDNYNISNKQ